MSNTQFSKRISNLHSSPIREILAVIDQPGMVSFAGGLPSPDIFPTFDLHDMPQATLQYGASEGEPQLRDHIAADLQAMGLEVKSDQIIVLSGSQQGIDLVAKLFIDRGTYVALESPTYLAALQVFRFFGMRAVTLDAEAPEQVLALSKHKPSLVYVIPTFQNPTGMCWSRQQREHLATTADDSGVVIFEDDPYRDLVYEPVDHTPVCAHLRRASWIYQGSFSKSMAPGLRLGFLAASPDLVPWLVRLKQATDLHSSRVSQWLVLNQLRDPTRESQLKALALCYRVKRDYFQKVLLQHFNDLATWHVPKGGLFFWLRLRVMSRTILD